MQTWFTWLCSCEQWGNDVGDGANGERVNGDD